VIGLYGLAVWTGLSLGPPIGEFLLRASSFTAVWAFAAAAPAIGAAVALAIPDPYSACSTARERGPLIARESIRPGAALSLATVGYAAMASFIVLDLHSEGIGLAGGLPDRIGPLRCAAGAALVEAAGLVLVAVASSLAIAIIGAVAMGAAFSTLYPALSLHVVNRVGETRRGAALGTFTAFFDAGVGLGAPLVGAAASLGGYSAAFWFAAACALGTAAGIAVAIRTATPAAEASAGSASPVRGPAPPPGA
jgi:MFS family permease